MEYKYEYMFFKIIFKKLNLSELERKLESEKIKPYDEKNMNDRISKYFALLNRGTSINFTEEESEIFNYYFSKEINELTVEPLYSEVESFIMKTYEKYFFSEAKEQYIYYGPASFEYMAPTDSIALGINYQKYGFNYSDKELERQEGVIVDMLNYIQNDLAKISGIKLSAIAYNEIALNQPFVKI